MNLDRPLDDFVKESRAKRALQRKNNASKAQHRKPAPSTQTKFQSSKNNNHNNKSARAPVNLSNVAGATKLTETGPANRRRRAGIAKKHRTRKHHSPPLRKHIPVAKPSSPPAQTENPSSPSPLPTSRALSPVRNVLTTPSPRSTSPRVHTSYTSPKERCVTVSVSNLHPGVTQADITELFETVGPLKRATLRKDEHGNSSGEAEVIFETMRDALCAIKKYNLVPLDNQPLHITLVTNHDHAPDVPSSSQLPSSKSPYHQDAPRQTPPISPRRNIPLNSPDHPVDVDESPELRHPDSRHPSSRHPDARHPDNRHMDNRHIDNRHADSRHVDNRRLDNRHGDNRAPNRHWNRRRPKHFSHRNFNRDGHRNYSSAHMERDAGTE